MMLYHVVLQAIRLSYMRPDFDPRIFETLKTSQVCALLIDWPDLGMRRTRWQSAQTGAHTHKHEI